jgi:Ca-activated chloride channel family protein
MRLTRMYPSNLPDLFQGGQLAIVGRYSGVGQTTITLEGRADQETKRFHYPVELQQSAGDHEFIPRLWATRRVGYLLDEIRLRGDHQELRDEVTELARKYGLVTPYTAYLILEDETRRGVPLSRQSLPQLNQDRPAQDVARQFYSRANQDKTGPEAVLSARYGLALKQADNAQAQSSSAVESERRLSAGRPVSPTLNRTRSVNQHSAGQSASRLVEYTQQSRFVNGRNFFLNGDQWVDSAVQGQTNAPRVKIEFNSREYFDLAKTSPTVGPWLALGQNVQFTLGGKVYEISAASP